MNSKDNTVDVLRYEDLSLISNINNDGMYIQCCLHVGRDHLIIGGFKNAGNEYIGMIYDFSLKGNELFKRIS